MPRRAWAATALVVSVFSALAGRAAAVQPDDPGLDVRRSGPHGLATFVTASSQPGQPAQAIAVNVPRSRQRHTGLAFWDQYGSLFGVTDPVAQLSVDSVEVDALARVRTTYRQVHEGVPVFTGVLKLHQDAQGRVLAANGRFYPIKPSLSTKPTVDEAAAQAAARAELAARCNPFVEESQLVIVDPGWYGDAPTGPKLAYRIILTDLAAGVRESFFVNAHSGEILDQWSLIEQLLNRRVHDANQSAQLPGPLARTEGDPPVANSEVNKAYDFSRDFYDFLSRGFGRDSIDNNGAILRSTVNSRSTGCPNAYWNGFQSVYCTGVVTDDIVAHELCHGLIDYTAALIYQNQPGQLNESFADIFGELVDLYNGDVIEPGPPAGTAWPSISPSAPGTDTPNNLRTACSLRPGHADGVRWLIGEDSAGFGGALRDMAQPTCLNDPDRANSPLQICQPLDAGGVHHGSGIPNKAFVLAVDGGTHNGFTITGIGAIKAGAVWYRALTTYLHPASDFKDAHDALLQSAVDLWGVAPTDPRTGMPSASAITSFDIQQLTAALQAVELNTDGVCGQTNDVLDQTPPDECANPVLLLQENFESGAIGWTVTNSAPPTPYDWVLTTQPLPYARPGIAWFCADLTTSNCGIVNETSTHTLISPVIAVPAGAGKPVLAFTHYVATEGRFDGGRVEVSVAGGPWTPIARQHFDFNPYNSVLMASNFGNSSPFAGLDAFSGVGGRWGRSLINLNAYGVAGQNIQLRWVFAKDSCDGGEGWYVDDVAVYTCPDCDGNAVPDIDQFVFQRSYPSAMGIGWQNDESVVITNPPQASGSVKLEFLTIGDFAGTEEIIDVRVNNVLVGRLYELGGIDCAATPMRASLSVPMATWNTAASSGTVTVNMSASPFVSAFDCNGSSIAMHIRYPLAAADQDGDQVLDSCDCPIITQEPQPLSVVDGQVALFTAAAIGQTPLSHQWQLNEVAVADGPSAGGGVISGATTDTLTITGAGMADAGGYRVVVSNTCGESPSATAVLTMSPACPTVSTHPAPLTIDAGQAAVFTVVSGGTAPFTYRWRRGGVDLSDGPSLDGGTISGATTDTLTITAAGYYDAGSFDCVITNPCGSATSNAAGLTVNAVCPVITVQPQPQTVVDGGIATWTVEAIGLSPFSYQWRLAGVNLTDGPATGGGVIAGATAATLTITGASFPDAMGAYDVVVTNSCGSSTSNGAALTITPACPTVTAGPDPLTIDAGQNASFTVSVAGTAPFTYQWRRNGVDLTDGPSLDGGTVTGAAAATLTTTGAGYYDAASFDCVISNACGTPTTSAAAALTVNAVCPIITQPPQGSTITDGGNASFSVTALGLAPLSYQWRRNGVDLVDGPSMGGGVIVGAAASTMTLTGAGMTDAGGYDVVITNSCGAATSSAASLTLNPACPTVTAEPQPLTIDAGQTAMFTVTVSGTSPFTYQWRRNGVELTDGSTVGGGTSSGSATGTLTITDAGYEDAGMFDCVVSNACGTPVTSAVAALTVNPVCPIITQPPMPVTATDGDDVAFSVTAIGVAPFTYQWRRNGVDIGDGPSLGGGVVSGATTAALAITGAGMLDAGSYDVIVFNACGNATAAPAVLTMNPVCASILGQPAPLTIDAGQNAVFSVTVSGTAPFAYQWRRNGADLADGPSVGGGTISGATTNTLTITAAGYFDAASFDCVISDACGTPVTSTAAALAVNPICPIVTQPPQPVTATDGDLIMFSVTAIGAAPFSYQWRIGGVDLVDGPSVGGGLISGATTGTLTITAAGMLDAGSYDVVVSNGCGQATSAAAGLTMNPACPSITGQPAPLTIDAGQNAVFSVTVSGTAPFAYQWRRNGAALVNGPSFNGGVIAGADTDTLTITSVGYFDSASFDCIVSNACGTPATSTAASLTVNAVCPVILQHPQPQTVVDFTMATFSVAAVGQATLGYQWRLGGVNLADGPAAGGGTLAGVNTDTLTITGVTAADALAAYDVVISNNCGTATSTSATLTITAACPSVTAEPQPLTIDAGQDAMFSVTVAGTAPFTYQWRRNGGDLVDGPSVGGGVISGATTSTLTITGAGYFDAANCDCVISNACGTPATSSIASLTVAAICPVITQPPTPQMATDGGTVMFTVTAVGQATLAYQWRRDGVDLADGPSVGGGVISGATTDTLTISGVGLMDAASASGYDVVVTNTCGSATSAAAALTVNPACPVITTDPQPVTMDAGLNAMFSVTATGTAPLSYQWRRNGVDLVDGPSLGGGTISGATTAALTITAFGYPDAGDYDVVVSNACGPTTSAAAALTVTNACAADFNESGIVSVQDIFDFLSAYFANDPRTDFNNSGVISVQDIFDYLAAYFTGCP